MLQWRNMIFPVSLYCLNLLMGIAFTPVPHLSGAVQDISVKIVIPWSGPSGSWPVSTSLSGASAISTGYQPNKHMPQCLHCFCFSVMYFRKWEDVKGLWEPSVYVTHSRVKTERISMAKYLNCSENILSVLLCFSKCVSSLLSVNVHLNFKFQWDT